MDVIAEGTKVTLKDAWISRLERTLQRQGVADFNCGHLRGRVATVKVVGDLRGARRSYRLVFDDSPDCGTWYPQTAIQVVKTV